MFAYGIVGVNKFLQMWPGRIGFKSRGGMPGLNPFMDGESRETGCHYYTYVVPLIYIYIYIYIHPYTYKHMGVYVCMHVCVALRPGRHEYVFMLMNASPCIYEYVCIHIPGCLYTYMCV